MGQFISKDFIISMLDDISLVTKSMLVDQNDSEQIDAVILFLQKVLKTKTDEWVTNNFMKIMKRKEELDANPPDKNCSVIAVKELGDFIKELELDSHEDFDLIQEAEEINAKWKNQFKGFEPINGEKYMKAIDEISEKIKVKYGSFVFGF